MFRRGGKKKKAATEVKINSWLELLSHGRGITVVSVPFVTLHRADFQKLSTHFLTIGALLLENTARGSQTSDV